MPELFLLPASQTRDKDAVQPEQMVGLCNDLRPQFDFIVLDSPAGIERGFRVALAPADEVIIVTTPEVSAVRDADRVIGLVEAAEKPPPKLIINRLKHEMVRRGDMLSPDDVMEILAVDLVGLVPEDEAVVVSTNRGQPLVLDGNMQAGRAFRDIARRLMGEEVPLTAPKSAGLFSRIVRLIRQG
jgi:septum site-determining protein MinD